jgi:nucleotide-binding universal stress UspA family protein
MVWIRVTRVMADTAAIHEPVLLNTANIISIEHMQEATYIYLRDGRHFAVTESIETLGAALVPVTAAEYSSETAVHSERDQQEPSAMPLTPEHAYALPPQHLLVPLDCRAHTRHVFDYALALAEKLQARLTLLHILEMPAAESAEGYVSVSVADYIRQQEAERRRTLDAYAQQVQRAGLRCETVLTHGVPFQQILNRTRNREVDLILMGTQGRTGLPHLVLGSVAEKVVRLAPCPVLVVHGKA